MHLPTTRRTEEISEACLVFFYPLFQIRGQISVSQIYSHAFLPKNYDFRVLIIVTKIKKERVKISPFFDIFNIFTYTDFKNSFTTQFETMFKISNEEYRTKTKK